MSTEKMRVIGYMNPIGYFPMFLVIILESQSGSIYSSWPRPDIKAIRDWGRAIARGIPNFIPEKRKIEMEVDKENPTDENTHVAFSLQGEAGDIKVLSQQKMFEHLQTLLSSGKLSDEEKENVAALHKVFWE